MIEQVKMTTVMMIVMMKGAKESGKGQPGRAECAREDG
jgi:hypothetical protein